MQYRLFGLSLSLLIHGGILLIVLFISQNLPEKNKIVTVNLSILEPEDIDNKDTVASIGSNDLSPVMPEKNSPPIEKEIKNPVIKPIQNPVTAQPTQPSTQALMRLKSKSIPICSSSPKKVVSAGPAISKPADAAQAEQGPGNPNPDGDNRAGACESGDGPQSGTISKVPADREGAGAATAGKGLAGEKTYYQVNYDSIRNRLRDSLIYPKIARKSGWAGEVIVSFLILPNGAASDIRIKKSCGIALLDGSAMQTIEKACPFPNPSAAERIVIPIAFQLE